VIDTVALREKVLDLAIRGKLVPQDPNDEPASVLLERIRAQKQQMVKDGKLKPKDIKDDSIIFVGEDNLHYEKFADGSVKCIEDEIPFELPDGWEWERLSNLASFSGGKTPSTSNREYWEGNILWVTSKDMKCKYINSSLLMISEKGLEQMQLYPENTLLLVTRSGILRHTIPVAILKKPATINQDLKAIMPYIANLEEYIYICIKGMESRLILEYTKVGATVENINFDAFKKILLPIPPENQIQRIITASNEADVVIDKMKCDQEDLIDIIGKTKSKILDLAIRGKLVPQNPDDEPASVLLERIRTEKEELIKQGKIKRDKKESVIFKGEDNSYYEKFDDGEIKCVDDYIPFELPESWCWCRLGTLFTHNTGKALNSSDSEGTLMPYITTSNLYWDRFELDSLKEMPFTDSEIEKCTVTKGDLLVCEGGDIGRSAIWMFDEDIRIQNHIHRLRPYISLHNRFYYYVMFMWKQMGLIGGQGIGLQGFSSKALHNLLVPLPPVDEQTKIVASVDKLFETIVNIEKSLS